MLIWGWNMHHSQKIGILALDSKYPSCMCLLYGMAEWNELHGEQKQKFLIILMGEKGKEKKEKYNLACTLFFQSYFSKAEIDAQSHDPAHCSLQLHWSQVRVQHYLESEKKIKIITTKYFLSQLELLIWLQHPATGESVWKLISAPYSQPLDHLLLLVYFLLFLVSLWRAAEMQVFSPYFYVANPYLKWRKGQTGG